MYDNVTKPDVLAHLWKAMIQPILLYSFTDNNDNIAELDKSHTRLLKSVIVLHKYYRIIPLLNAMNVNKIKS